MLRFLDVCKQDLKDLNIDGDKWEDVAADRPAWRAALSAGKKAHHAKWMTKLEEARSKRKLPANPTTALICNHCGRPCASRIGLISHTRACERKKINSLYIKLVGRKSAHFFERNCA